MSETEIPQLVLQEARECATRGAELLDKRRPGWAAEIDRLTKLPAVSPDGAEALKRAQTFIADGWALQAVRLGWGEVELFGVCPVAPWQRLDRKGVAFGGAVQAVTAESVTYVGGQRRYRAQVNNDNGAVPIWELAAVYSPGDHVRVHQLTSSSPTQSTPPDRPA